MVKFSAVNNAAHYRFIQNKNIKYLYNSAATHNNTLFFSENSSGKMKMWAILSKEL